MSRQLIELIDLGWHTDRAGRQRSCTRYRVQQALDGRQFIRDSANVTVLVQTPGKPEQPEEGTRDPERIPIYWMTITRLQSL
tara:strand:- start:37 stop:282 length:246 start_codon:yes stop_codon:yes gene_type:complete